MRGAGGRRALALLLGLLLLSGCGAERSGPPPGCAPGEGRRLVVYTSHKEELYAPIIQEFERRTGIWVEVEQGGTNEMLGRLRQEKDHPRADVMFGGGAESLEAARECLKPYVSPESAYVDGDLLPADGLWTPFSALPVVLVYNTKLAAGGDRPGSWDDLLSPRFQGRVAFADPSLSGAGFTALATYLCAVGGEREPAIRRLAAALGGRQLKAAMDALDSVAQGDCLVGVALEDAATQYIAQGANIGMAYPLEGTSCIPDGSALVNGAPHEDNAKLFLDFTISREVQELLSYRFYRRAVRPDVGWPGELADLSQVALLDYDVRRAARERESILAEWDACMGDTFS